MSTKESIHHRLERVRAPTVASSGPGQRPNGDSRCDAVVDCGWGRLLFGQTFGDLHQLARVLQEERPGKRDVALYLRDPHVVLSYAPQDLFLDPLTPSASGSSATNTRTAGRRVSACACSIAATTPRPSIGFT